MTRLVLAGRKWNVASDDFVGPAVCALFIRLLWAAALAYLDYHVTSQIDLAQCGFGFINIYLGGLSALIVIGILLDIGLALASGSGTIPDDRPRKHVPGWLWATFVCGLAEAALAGWGIYVVFFRPPQPCDEIAMAQVDYLDIVLQCVVISHSVFVGIWIVGGIATFGASSPVSRESLTPFQRAEARRQRWTRRCSLLRYWTDVSIALGISNNVFEDVGRLLADVFEAPSELEMSLSDVIAGLALVRAVQKQNEIEAVQARVRAQLAESKETAESIRGWRITDQRTEHGIEFNPASPRELNTLIDAQHYYKFAQGVYGWMLYTYSRPTTGLCHVACCCGIMCCRQCGSSSSIQGDQCFCNQAAFRLETELAGEDILYANWANNSVCSAAYAVVIDHVRQSLVITIRGTLSVNDLITDAMAEPADVAQEPLLESMQLPDGTLMAHRGIWATAKIIYQSLLENRVLAVLDNLQARSELKVRMPLLTSSSHLRLVVVGHSLGAGVASLLSLLLRAKYPDLLCFAYSPPGSLVSEPLAEWMEMWTTSIVVGKDLVPRLSVPSLYELMDNMIDLTKRARVSKHNVLCQTCGCFAPTPRDVLLAPTGATPQMPRTVNLRAFQRQMADLEGGMPYVDHHLFMPGKILHFAKQGTRRRLFQKFCALFCTRCEPDREYVPMWADRMDFREILVSVLMVDDHMPHKVAHVLRNSLHSALRPELRPEDRLPLTML